MKKFLMLIFLLVFSGCVMAQAEQKVNQKDLSLTAKDISQILSLAVQDLEKQGYTAKFLSERQGFIWAMSKDGKMRIYRLNELIKKYQEGKEKNFFYTYGFIGDGQENVNFFIGKSKAAKENLNQTFASKNGFIAAAACDLTGKGKFDIWTIDESKNIKHIQDGLK